MKSILFFFCLLAIGGHLIAQNIDTIPPYKKTRHLPSFKILQTDSTWLKSEELPKKPLLIIYFSPECSHCQLTAKEYVANMKKLEDVTLLWVSYHTPQQIKTFGVNYGLNQFANVKMGRDQQYFLPVFFHVQYTPFMAAYDKNGLLLETWAQGTDPDSASKIFYSKK